jgi:ABC-2 type transport system ATP-binding protein
VNGVSIHTEGLTKHYNGVHALSDLSIDIPARSIIGFLGPNGAGKSTTIKLLLGLIHPTAGGGTIFGKDITRDSRAIRQYVGYLAQQPRFDETMTARQTLRFVARFFYNAPARLIEQRVDESLALVGLLEKADRPVRGFSGGELQRLGIAQAQINRPDLLILDEPAAALDPMGRRDVLQIMEQLRTHTTIFYSTHILDDVQRVSDHVVILNKGKLVAQGEIQTLLQAHEGVVYRLLIRGSSDAIQVRLQQQPWVSSIQVQQDDTRTLLRVGIRDRAAADVCLLRLVLAHADVEVLEYRPETYELEDVFIQLVK